MTDALVYQICTSCVMDTTDPGITFDSAGICDHCVNYQRRIQPTLTKRYADPSILEVIARTIRGRRNGKYDCIIGLSGGLDSSYAAHVAIKQMKLRPLLLHVDAGWNTDQAVSNIASLVDGLDLPLHTEVVNWEEFKDLQRSLFFSGIPDLDIVQDTAFFSALYKYATANGIRSVVTGGNYTTEGCREPIEWGAYPGIDKTLLSDIHGKFGKRKLDSFPIVDIFQYRIWYRLRYGMRVYRPLDYIPYIKTDAERILAEEYGWESFPHKHHESRFNRILEDHYLPNKFGFQKRRAHFSSLINSKQMLRADAIALLKSPVLSEDQTNSEVDYLCSKLGFSAAEYTASLTSPNKTFADYKNKKKLIDLAALAGKLVTRERRLIR
jgi:N-acetyl sugar amidotransferase